MLQGENPLSMFFVFFFSGRFNLWGKVSTNKHGDRFVIQQDLESHSIHSGKLTWIPKITVWKKVPPFKHRHFWYLC